MYGNDENARVWGCAYVCVDDKLVREEAARVRRENIAAAREERIESKHSRSAAAG